MAPFFHVCVCPLPFCFSVFASPVWLCDYSLHPKNVAFFLTASFLCEDVKISSWLSTSASYFFSVKEQKKDKLNTLPLFCFVKKSLRTYFPWSCFLPVVCWSLLSECLSLTVLLYLFFARIVLLSCDMDIWVAKSFSVTSLVLCVALYSEITISTWPFLTTSRWRYGQVFLLSHTQLFSSSIPYGNLNMQGCVCSFSKQAATFLLLSCFCPLTKLYISALILQWHESSPWIIILSITGGFSSSYLLILVSRYSTVWLTASLLSQLQVLHLS